MVAQCWYILDDPHAPIHIQYQCSLLTQEVVCREAEFKHVVGVVDRYEEHQTFMYKGRICILSQTCGFLFYQT